MIPPTPDRMTGLDSIRPAWDWLRRLLVCNPFFLGSAALLLFGLNRLSVDPGFLEREEAKLLFNFSALEAYEILVVATAIILSRRALWYDSALLVVLDQGLTLAPFLLVTQGVMIDPVLGTVLVSCAALMAMARIWAVRQGFPRFQLPGRLLTLGGGILAVNLFLPLRLQAVVRAGTVTDWEPYNDLFWLAVLPALVVSILALPRPSRHGGIAPERPWLPLMIGGLWVAATGIHGWSCAYIGKQPMTAAFLAPAVTAAAWVLAGRLDDFLPVPTRKMRLTAWGAAFAAPALALGHDRLFPLLTAAGAIALARLAFLHPSERRELRSAAGLSLMAALLGLPFDWITLVPVIPDRDAWMVAVSGILVVLASLFRFTARRGLLAGTCIGAGILHWNRMTDGNLALQVGLAWIAVHSLFWREEANRSERAARNTVLGLWILAAWNRPDTAIPSGLAVNLLAGFGLATLWICVALRRGWTHLPQVPAVAAVLAASTPGAWIVQHGPAGLLALAGSLGLFAVGCLLAWNRGRWERGPHRAARQDAGR